MRKPCTRCTHIAVSRRKDTVARSDVRLDIRVTAEERAKIKHMADEHNISMSDLIRSLVASEETRRAVAARVQARMSKG